MNDKTPILLKGSFEEFETAKDIAFAFQWHDGERL
jgi:hypothetical protein